MEKNRLEKTNSVNGGDCDGIIDLWDGEHRLSRVLDTLICVKEMDKSIIQYISKISDHEGCLTVRVYDGISEEMFDRIKLLFEIAWEKQMEYCVEIELEGN